MAGICQIIAGALVLGSVASAGCSGGFHWAGTWRGRLNLTTANNGQDVIANSLDRVDLRIEPDGSFVLITESAPKSGTLKFTGGKAHLVVEEYMNRRIDPDVAKRFDEITLTPRDENTIVFEDRDLRVPRGGVETPARVELRRQTQPAKNG